MGCSNLGGKFRGVVPELSPELEKGFTLGQCSIQPGQHRIMREGEPHAVEPKSMAVLLELAASNGETVTREHIVSTVWPRGFVTDDVLNRCISQLRSALGDDSKNPEYIATVPRKGYRLVVPVETGSEETLDGVLVLPFQNLAAHGKDAYLADGLTELLIARLAVSLDQRVISRTTAMSYKGGDPDIEKIRRKLGVHWVVEGSLLQLGEQLQIVVQLIDVRTDAHAWAETWTRNASDIMTVLNEVTRHISTQINQRLKEPESKPVRHESLPDELMRRYLQGMHHASRRAAPSLRQAIVCFKDVLSERPNHAPALAGLALCYMLLVHYNAEPADTGVPKVRKLSERALQIDPRNALAMGNLAAADFFHSWDFDSTAELTEAALAIEPNLEMIMMLSANVNLINGRYEQSQQLVDKAIASDPLNLGFLMNAGDLLILQRRYGEAIGCLSQALELEPAMRPARLRLALAHALNGQHEEAKKTLALAAETGKSDAAYLEYDALVNGLAGRLEEARASAETLEKLAEKGGVQPWSLARAWAACGEKDKSIANIELAWQARSTSMPFLGQTPVFDSLRQSPEVKRIMARIGLPA